MGNFVFIFQLSFFYLRELEVAVHFGSPPLAAHGSRWTWLNLLSVPPRGSTLYRFQTGQRSARRPIFKSGHRKAQGSVRSALRSKSFILLKEIAATIVHRFIVQFSDDTPGAFVHAVVAARGIGLCRSAT